HDDDALARDLGQRVELQSDALLAQALIGLDERAADIAVLDQPFAERDVQCAGEADRRRSARVGNGKDEVGIRRRLLGQALTHAHASSVHLDPLKARVGPREIEELEDAERATFVLRYDLPRLDSLVDNHQLARSQLSLELGADQVERARLGSDDPVVVETSEAERPHSPWVAEGDQLSLGKPNDGKR